MKNYEKMLKEISDSVSKYYPKCTSIDWGKSRTFQDSPTTESEFISDVQLYFQIYTDLH
jgi:hypothetical protein